ncbi:ribokinase [Frischella sp. Ac13]|uniref:Ribokinase n=1 Tax=Frischella japonica TaxID=2741544 RepID=A0ABR7R0B1_9GAMM|nr:ribokinase [Frischella japonica]MBC9131760.1 ribokinase [Frischella japonica]
MKHDVVVIGSLNYDILIQQDRLPYVGETFIGNELLMMPGGKGANQAVQCAKLGLNVKFIGCVGNDIYGGELLKSLINNNIATDDIYQRGPNSGIGIVQILASGDYCSTIIKGANYLLTKNDIKDTFFTHTKLVIFQSEVPVDVVEYAIERAKFYGSQIIVNNAPARHIPTEILAKIDYLIINETEATFMSNQDIVSIDDAQSCAYTLCRDHNIKNVIITLGEQGAIHADENKALHYPAVFCPQVIDTTGAGDSFIGGIAWGIIHNRPIAQIMPFAAEISAYSIQKYGGQSSFPLLSDVKHALKTSD